MVVEGHLNRLAPVNGDVIWERFHRERGRVAALDTDVRQIEHCIALVLDSDRSRRTRRNADPPIRDFRCTQPGRRTDRTGLDGNGRDGLAGRVQERRGRGVVARRIRLELDSDVRLTVSWYRRRESTIHRLEGGSVRPFHRNCVDIR